MTCLVLYSSVTGNTKKLAEAIYEQLDGQKAIHTIKEPVNFADYDLLLLGYWVKKGGCDKLTKKIWENIHGKKIMLFGTMGTDVNSEAGKALMKRIEEALPKDNTIVGHFACQGEMSLETKKQYRRKLTLEPKKVHLKPLLDNFNNCLNHPDKIDLLEAKRFVYYAMDKGHSPREDA